MSLREITYSLAGELLFLYHCHCVECRRFSGASFATNATVVRADLNIIDPPAKVLDANLWTSEKCPWAVVDPDVQNFEKAPHE